MRTDVTIPPAWEDLIKALTILAQHPANDISPLHCEHDTLWVCADPDAFSPEELAELDELGFFKDDGGFMSYRFGSA